MRLSFRNIWLTISICSFLMTFTSVVSFRFSLFRCSTSNSREATFSSCKDSLEVIERTVFLRRAKSVVKDSKACGDRCSEEVSVVCYCLSTGC